MDRKYIKDLLNCPCMIHRISKGKTQCSHIMTDFYFFIIFFEALRNAKIICSIHHSCENYHRYMIFKKSNDELKILINEDILKLGLSKYNTECQKETTSFIDSTLMLINIFTDLLG